MRVNLELPLSSMGRSARVTGKILVRGKSFQSGLTMIELLLAVTILGVILGIGVPTMREFVTLVRVTGNTRDLVSSLKFAQSEAVKQSSTVSICVASDTVADTCDTDATAPWDQGWIVFNGAPSADGVIDDPTDILQISPKREGIRLAFADPQTAQNSFSFLVSGEMRSLDIAPQRITTCNYDQTDTDCSNAIANKDPALTIAILTSGQIITFEPES